MNNFYINSNESLYEKLNVKDYYSMLETELQSLSDAEITDLSHFKPYIEANNRLAMIIQAELLNLVRSQINGHSEEIKNVIDSIKKFKNKENEQFKDYIKNYSHLTYNEYLNQISNENR